MTCKLSARLSTQPRSKWLHPITLQLHRVSCGRKSEPCISVQAIVLAPHRALPHVAACISMGRLAVFSDAKTKV